MCVTETDRDIALTNQAHAACKNLLQSVLTATPGELRHNLKDFLTQTDDLTRLPNKVLLGKVVTDISLETGESKICGNADHLGKGQPAVIYKAWDEQTFGVLLNLDRDFSPAKMTNRGKLEIVEAFVTAMSQIITSKRRQEAVYVRSLVASVLY